MVILGLAAVVFAMMFQQYRYTQSESPWEILLDRYHRVSSRTSWPTPFAGLVLVTCRATLVFWVGGAFVVMLSAFGIYWHRARPTFVKFASLIFPLWQNLLGLITAGALIFGLFTTFNLRFTFVAVGYLGVIGIAGVIHTAVAALKKRDIARSLMWQQTLTSTLLLALLVYHNSTNTTVWFWIAFCANAATHIAVVFEARSLRRGSFGETYVHLLKGTYRLRRENECRSCGYLLIGLDTPRCPECGTPFTPKATQTLEFKT